MWYSIGNVMLFMEDVGGHYCNTTELHISLFAPLWLMYTCVYKCIFYPLFLFCFLQKGEWEIWCFCVPQVLFFLGIVYSGLVNNSSLTRPYSMATFITNVTDPIPSQGTKADVGRRAADERGDIRHPHAVESRPRWLPGTWWHGVPWGQGSLGQPGVFRPSPWGRRIPGSLQRKSGRAGVWWPPGIQGNYSLCLFSMYTASKSSWNRIAACHCVNSEWSCHC